MRKKVKETKDCSQATIPRPLFVFAIFENNNKGRGVILLKILLLGAQGQVGWELQRSLALLGNVIALTRNELNVESLDNVRYTVQEHNPQIIVNAVAYTNVDKAETESTLATRVNADMVAILADEIKKTNGLLIHYSTDYVFDGNLNRSYSEDDLQNPLNVYGITKQLSENLIKASGCNYLIFRTSWVHAARGKNFINTMLRLIKDKEQLNIVADQVGTPTSAALIADVSAIAIQNMVKDGVIDASLSGIYHLTAAGETSWYDYARYITSLAQQLGYAVKVTADKIHPLSTADYGSPAARPAYSVLNTSKLSKQFNVVLPDWQSLVKRTVSEVLTRETV